MAILTGTHRRDTLIGSAEADSAAAAASRDRLEGRAGHDTLSGGEGRDAIFGGAGNDVLFGLGASDAQPGSGRIIAARVATGFDAPVFVTSAPGDPDRLFVVEKTGRIEILNPATGTANVAPFLSIPAGEISSTGEQGLLGLAFHPGYAANGRFFVFVVNAAGDLEVRAYLRSGADPDRADAASGDVILTIPHPGNTNHNGGWLGFGPDGYLYIATGDGGGSGDPANNAQDTGVLLGKILRIDVDGDDFPAEGGRDYAIPPDNPFVGGAGADEIWAFGLRNPWRPSFDRLTGDLYIADVGQGAREEVNFQAAGSAGGANYGWKVKEGRIVFDDNVPGNPAPTSPALTDPLIDYGRQAGQSVTGGYVYRGIAGGMQGVYFYADFVSGQLWSFRVVGGRAVDAANRTDQLVAQGGSVDNVASFGEDGHGNLYIVDFDGDIFRLTPGIGAGDGADFLSGGNGRDRILGGVGDDSLFGGAGRDTLNGNGQDDLIAGNAGRDHLRGAVGADTFDFNTPTDSRAGNLRDVILDFGAGDRLDFKSIDARPGEAGNQAFNWIGASAFSGAGQVRAYRAGDAVVVSVNIEGTGTAEMQIVLRDIRLADLNAGDFIL
jgi:glucose/arabinose dehydrogenase